MQFELIEPLNTLFATEVRALGMLLGMPDSLVWRQPFQAQEVSVFELSAKSPKKLVEILWIRCHSTRRDWQPRLRTWRMAILHRTPGFKSVGPWGWPDLRLHHWDRAVTPIVTDDHDFARLPWEVLQVITRLRIVNEVAHVNRVVYDIAG